MSTVAVTMPALEAEDKAPNLPAGKGALEMKIGAEFDPVKHLTFKRPSKVYSMTDLNLPKETGLSPVAVSEPFPLFTQDAVRQMRAEVLSPEVMKNCQYKSELAQCQLRGFAAKFVPKHSRKALRTNRRQIRTFCI